MSNSPSRPASPRPPRNPRPSFYLDAADSDDDFYGGSVPNNTDDVNEIVPADEPTALLVASPHDHHLSASDSTHPSNVFADPLTPSSPSPVVDPYRFPMSFRDSIHSGPYAAVPQQPNSPRVSRNAGPPPSSYIDARPDSPATTSRNGHTEESYFIRPEAPFMRPNARLSDSSRSNSAGFAPPAPWTMGPGSRVSFGGSASMTGQNDSTIGTARYRTRRKGSFTSNMLKDPIEKPWLGKPDRWATFGQWLTRFLFLLGVCAAAALCYFGFTGIDRIGRLCLVMEDNFDTLDTNTWRREVAVGGFGNGEFQWYTNDDENCFVENGNLYIVPTLTSDAIGADKVENGGSIAIDGCTSSNKTECTAVGNVKGNSVVNPVRSARISTMNASVIQYGKIEVRAKMPKGDWLWPAIWMLPVQQTYGPWPMSGEIDIAESRGNNMSYPAQGNNFISSALHWGPKATIDAWLHTWGWIEQRRASYADAFHTYTLEWTKDFMRFYIDKRTVSGLELSFRKKSLFDLAKFPQIISDSGHQEILENPWADRGNNAPFDQEFYLILNVAAGGTNGRFPDGVGEKPWADQSLSAMADFFKAQDKWSATWPSDVKERAMVVDSVKMWKLC